jgi:short-subunit dehydrogenase
METGVKPEPARAILITGASSGIGAALARAYAAPGVRLFLGGRDAGRLAEVAGSCRETGAHVETATVDVTDRAATAKWVLAADGRQPLDLVIANAGVSGGTGGLDESEDQVREVFAVNLAGVLNTVLPVVPAMRRRRRGQIAIMSSLAAFRGVLTAPAYGASKAAAKSYGEALRPLLAADGVRVSVICPGFVKTPMSDANRYRTPLMISAEKAARIIRRGLARDKGRIAFPALAHAFAWTLAALPPAVGDWLLKRAPRKR